MYTKPLLIILLLSTFIYATETNTSTDAIKEKAKITQVSIDLNSTIIENNISTETNTSIIKIEKSFPSNKRTSKSQNFNMTKGDSKRGEDIFIKNLKKRCLTTSYKFANTYSQDEWEEIAESGRFREIIFKLCLNVQKFYQDDWSPDLYQFAYEHANEK